MKLSAGNRAVLIGTDDVGATYTYSLVNQGTVDHLVIIDIDEKKMIGNVMDLSHGVVWALLRIKVTRDTYADYDDAALVIIYTGVT